jgi:16S rRNA (uracil1498-N3)-methyltransferase
MMFIAPAAEDGSLARSMPYPIRESMFYCPGLSPGVDVVTVDGEEAHHILTSRRRAVGDVIWIFDGRGTVARATVVAKERRARTLRVQVQEREFVPRVRPHVELACALPKGERQAVLLDMATQLGITDFRPLLCERSIARPGPQAARRWHRICIEACKQSRRPHVPAVHAALTPAQAVASTNSDCTIWVADQKGMPLHARPSPRTKHLLLMVGPEGGFTDAEITGVADSGAQLINLGAGILRVETAAVALLAHVMLSSRV